MSYLEDEASRGEERLIEDYLFSGYNNYSRPTRDKDQQFARPIEDEDLFSVDKCPSTILESELQTRNSNDGSDGNGAQPDREATPEWEDMPAEASTPDKTAPEMGKLPSETLTPAQLKLARLKERINQSRKITPLKEARTIRSQLDDDEMIELTFDEEQLISNTESKFRFHTLLTRAKQVKGGKLNAKTWAQYKDLLRKKMSADKRKVWDSFQKPVADYNDEEEMVEEKEDEDEDGDTGAELQGDQGEQGEDNANDEDMDGEDQQEPSFNEDEELGGHEDVDDVEEEIPKRRYRQISDDEDSGDDFERLEKEEMATSEASQSNRRADEDDLGMSDDSRLSDLTSGSEAIESD